LLIAILSQRRTQPAGAVVVEKDVVVKGVLLDTMEVVVAIAVEEVDDWLVVVLGTTKH
jgi:hypothetical protein